MLIQEVAGGIFDDVTERLFIPHWFVNVLEGDAQYPFPAAEHSDLHDAILSAAHGRGKESLLAFRSLQQDVHLHSDLRGLAGLFYWIGNDREWASAWGEVSITIDRLRQLMAGRTDVIELERSIAQELAAQREQGNDIDAAILQIVRGTMRFQLEFGTGALEDFEEVKDRAPTNYLRGRAWAMIAAHLKAKSPRSTVGSRLRFSARLQTALESAKELLFPEVSHPSDTSSSQGSQLDLISIEGGSLDDPHLSSLLGFENAEFVEGTVGLDKAVDSSHRDQALSFTVVTDVEGTTAEHNIVPVGWATIRRGLTTLPEEHLDEAAAIIATRREEIDRQKKFQVAVDMARALFPELAEKERVTDQDLTTQFAKASKRDPSEFKGEKKKQPYVDLVKAFRDSEARIEIDGVEVRMALTKPFKAKEKAFATMLPVKGRKGVKTYWTPPPLIFTFAAPRT